MRHPGAHITTKHFGWMAQAQAAMPTARRTSSATLRRRCWLPETSTIPFQKTTDCVNVPTRRSRSATRTILQRNGQDPEDGHQAPHGNVLRQRRRRRARASRKLTYCNSLPTARPRAPADGSKLHHVAHAVPAGPAIHLRSEDAVVKKQTQFHYTKHHHYELTISKHEWNGWRPS